MPISMKLVRSGVAFGALVAAGGLGCFLACGSAFTNAPADAGTDVGTVNDAPSVGDGVADTAEAAAPFCASQSPAPFFCDDFDERMPGDVKGSWDALVESGNGTAAIDTTTFLSPPASFNASMNQSGMLSASGSAAALNLGATLGRVKEVHIQFDVNVQSYGSDPTDASFENSATILQIKVGSGVTMDLAIQTQNATAPMSPYVATFVETYPVDGATDFTADKMVGLPAGMWSHVKMDVVLPVAVVVPQGNVKITIDGVLALSVPLNEAPTVSPDGSLTLGVLVGAQSDPKKWIVNFDNVTIDRTSA